MSERGCQLTKHRYAADVREFVKESLGLDFRAASIGNVQMGNDSAAFVAVKWMNNHFKPEFFRSRRATVFESEFWKGTVQHVDNTVVCRRCVMVATAHRMLTNLEVIDAHSHGPEPPAVLPRESQPTVIRPNDSPGAINNNNIANGGAENGSTSDLAVAQSILGRFTGAYVDDGVYIALKLPVVRELGHACVQDIVKLAVGTLQTAFDLEFFACIAGFMERLQVPVAILWMDVAEPLIPEEVGLRAAGEGKPLLIKVKAL
jgi:hypothetical protein